MKFDPLNWLISFLKKFFAPKIENQNQNTNKIQNVSGTQNVTQTVNNIYKTNTTYKIGTISLFNITTGESLVKDKEDGYSSKEFASFVENKATPLEEVLAVVAIDATKGCFAIYKSINITSLTDISNTEISIGILGKIEDGNFYSIEAISNQGSLAIESSSFKANQIFIKFENDIAGKFVLITIKS